MITISTETLIEQLDDELRKPQLSDEQVRSNLSILKGLYDSADREVSVYLMRDIIVLLARYTDRLEEILYPDIFVSGIVKGLLPVKLYSLWVLRTYGSGDHQKLADRCEASIISEVLLEYHHMNPVCTLEGVHTIFEDMGKFEKIEMISRGTKALSSALEADPNYEMPMFHSWFPLYKSMMLKDFLQCGESSQKQFLEIYKELGVKSVDAEVRERSFISCKQHWLMEFLMQLHQGHKDKTLFPHHELTEEHVMFLIEHTCDIHLLNDLYSIVIEADIQSVKTHDVFLEKFSLLASAHYEPASPLPKLRDEVYRIFQERKPPYDSDDEFEQALYDFDDLGESMDVVERKQELEPILAYLQMIPHLQPAHVTHLRGIQQRWMPHLQMYLKEEGEMDVDYVFITQLFRLKVHLHHFASVMDAQYSPRKHAKGYGKLAKDVTSLLNALFRNYAHVGDEVSNALVAVSSVLLQEDIPWNLQHYPWKKASVVGNQLGFEAYAALLVSASEGVTSQVLRIFEHLKRDGAAQVYFLRQLPTLLTMHKDMLREDHQVLYPHLEEASLEFIYLEREFFEALIQHAADRRVLCEIISSLYHPESYLAFKLQDIFMDQFQQLPSLG